MAQLKDTVVSGSLRATDTLYSTTAQFQILRVPTASNGTTYGPGSANNLLKSNGTSVYWTTLLASDIPNLSTDKLTSGTLPVGRGGTGQTSIANIQAGKDGDGNTISSTYLKLSGGTLTGILHITPATGEGGQLQLNAATSEVTKNSIILDNYYGAFRVFGGASADGTTRTGVGTPLVIDPYDKTITGGYTITGNLTGTASKATGDADGNTISSTYLKLSGGTLTGNLTISHATNATMTADSTNPKITFSESGSQPVHLIYTDYDNYRNPAGLKVIGGANANPAWFEVEGQIYTSGGTFKNIATSSNTSLYVQTNQNNGGIELRADGEGGNLKITGPNGTSYFEIDASNNTHLRVYSYSDFSDTSTYKTINWDRTSGNLLNNNGIIYAGNTSLTKEIQLRARSAAGEIYLFTQGSATGAKGLYSYNASGTGGGILTINQSNQISSLADISANINVVNGGIIIGTMADTVQRSINIRSATGRIVLYTGTSYKGFYAASAPTTDAPDGIGKDIIRINNDNDVDSLTYFKVPVKIKGLNSYASTPSSDLTTDLIQMYDSNLGIYHKVYSAMGTGGTRTLFFMTRLPGDSLTTYNQFGVRLNSDGSPSFSLSAKNNGESTNAAAQTSFRNMLGASSGIWPISLGGTGLTASPSILTNLGSTTAANVLQASPRPGITGTLGIGHGGTGATTATAYPGLRNLGLKIKKVTTGWTSNTNGNIDLGINGNRYQVLCVYDASAGYIYIPYLASNSKWSAHVLSNTGAVQKSVGVSGTWWCLYLDYGSAPAAT